MRAAGRLLGRQGTPDALYPPRLSVQEYVCDMRQLSELCCHWDHEPLDGNAAAIATRECVAKAFADYLRNRPDYCGKSQWVLDYHGYRRYCGRMPY